MFNYTHHARIAVQRRRIDVRWIEKTVMKPARVLQDPRDPELQHFLRNIAEFDNRVLRVVIKINPSPGTIVTAFFDRSMRGKI